MPMHIWMPMKIYTLCWVLEYNNKRRRESRHHHLFSINLIIHESMAVCHVIYGWKLLASCQHAAIYPAIDRFIEQQQPNCGELRFPRTSVYCLRIPFLKIYHAVLLIFCLFDTQISRRRSDVFQPAGDSISPSVYCRSICGETSGGERGHENA